MKIRLFIKMILMLGVISSIGVAGYYGYSLYTQHQKENKILKQIIDRLQADSRVAEVLVTKSVPNHTTGKTLTTIKFLEYDIQGQPLTPKYFTFQDNLIQFQSLVIRFDDVFVRQQDSFKGRSAYLFWKAFVLDAEDTQEHLITPINTIPAGYQLPQSGDMARFEEKLWSKFWAYALDSSTAKAEGVKNAQVEAPGTTFLPGYLYTLKIEHDGGLRIDAQPLSPILAGEKIVY